MGFTGRVDADSEDLPLGVTFDDDALPGVFAAPFSLIGNLTVETGRDRSLGILRYLFFAIIIIGIELQWGDIGILRLGFQPVIDERLNLGMETSRIRARIFLLDIRKKCRHKSGPLRTDRTRPYAR